MVVNQNATFNAVPCVELVFRTAGRAPANVRGAIPDIVRRLYFFTAMIAVPVVGRVFGAAIRAEEMWPRLFGVSLS